ncbi:hypothetical protein [Sphingopyxis sp. KK2]|uniref:hypothetical protein n=1 Tax=Sphingopyxis sp. KK2 TaxID=1855727 RepID=UPI00097E5B74|nr:hypothetical protein [Sphingopyxis sp. KK2]
MIASLAALLLAAPVPAYDAATAERCRTTSWDERDAGLKEVCSSFGVLLVDHLARQLGADDRAFALLCQGTAAEAARAADLDIDLGCMLVEAERTDAAVEALLADPPALEPRCAARIDADRDPALATACADRAKARVSGEIERLASDDAAYTRTCAAFAETAIDLSRDDLTDDQVACEHARYRRSIGIGVPPGWTAYAPPGETIETVMPLGPSTPYDALSDMPMPGDGSPFDRAARDTAAAIISRAKAGSD